MRKPRSKCNLVRPEPAKPMIRPFSPVVHDKEVADRRNMLKMIDLWRLFDLSFEVLTDQWFWCKHEMALWGLKPELES